MKNDIFVITFICLLSLVVNAKPLTVLEKNTRLTHWGVLINKDVNLYQITDNLYRGEQPFATDLALLKSLNIQTIVNLRPGRKDQIELAGTGINLVQVAIRTWSIKEEQIAEALWLIRQGQEKGGVLLHCYHGSDRTGLVAGMYRIIYQNWSIEEAKEEMKKGGYGFHSMWTNIEEFFVPQKIEQIKVMLQEKERSAQ